MKTWSKKDEEKRTERERRGRHTQGPETDIERE